MNNLKKWFVCLLVLIGSGVGYDLKAQSSASPEKLRLAIQTHVVPTHANVKYGPYDRNLMDVWLAKSNQPTPVLVSIHGGGFRTGNKGINYKLKLQCLDAGISVIAITYRLSQQAIAPAQFEDAARAIQFIRSQAQTWNLDPTRIAATGGSAGAGLSLWLGFVDDMAKPHSKDIVERQSTRLICMTVFNAQSSYDPRFIRKLFPEGAFYKHPALTQLFDVNMDQLDNLPAAKYKLFEWVSPLNHVTKDDVPVQLIYQGKNEGPIKNLGVAIHHPRFGKKLQQKMKSLGLPCEIHTGIKKKSNQRIALTMLFLKKHLLKHTQ